MSRRYGNEALIIYFSIANDNLYLERDRTESEVGESEKLTNLLHDLLVSNDFNVNTFKVERNKPYSLKNKECDHDLQNEILFNIKPVLKRNINPNYINESSIIFLVFPLIYGNMPKVLSSFIELNKNSFIDKHIVPIILNTGNGTNLALKELNNKLKDSFVLDSIDIIIDKYESSFDLVKEYLNDFGIL